MTDESGLQRESGGTTVYRPSPDGGLEDAPAPTADYRDRLLSRRWDAAPLRNPEAEKTDPRLAVLAVVIMAAITLGVLVLGYGSGLWSLPG